MHQPAEDEVYDQLYMSLLYSSVTLRRALCLALDPMCQLLTFKVSFTSSLNLTNGHHTTLIFAHRNIHLPLTPPITKSIVNMPTGKPLPYMMDNEVVEVLYTCVKCAQNNIDFDEAAKMLGLKNASTA